MSEYEAIRQLVADITRYSQTYLGKVLIDLDPKGKGRVMIAIPALGILNAAEGVWADVEMPIGKNVSPKKDDWVAVYFLDGDSAKPVVRGRVSIVADNLPSNANKKQVFYEDDDTTVYYDETAKKLTVESTYEVEVSVKNSTLTIDGDAKVSVSGDAEVEVSGDATVKGDGALTMEFGGDGSIKCDGDLSIECSGLTMKPSGDCSIEATGSATLKGKDVTLDGQSGVEAKGAKFSACNGDLEVM